MNKILLTLQRIEQLLLEQKSVLSIDEFCQYTGFSKSFTYKLTAQKRIPFSCPTGKLIFFSKQEVDKWLLANPISGTVDIDQHVINYLTQRSSRSSKRNGGTRWDV